MWIVLVTLLNLLLLNRTRILFYLLMILGIHCSSSVAVYAHVDVPSSSRVVVGAERMEEYLPLLQGQRIGILTNHTGRIGDAHIVDTLLARGINICRIFAPEHGFRGEADAGERVASTRDQKPVSRWSLFTEPTASPNRNRCRGLTSCYSTFRMLGCVFTHISPPCTT